VQGGWLTANEARAKVGLPAIDEKSQQVPLTQGEDNRFNLMTEMGLVTLNEVRESIGLPPRPDGNQLLKDVAPTTFSGKGPVSGSGPEGSPLAPATPALPQVDVVSGPGGGGLPALPGGDQPSGRQGAPGTGSDQKAAYALEALFNELGPDQALMMFKRSRGKGHSLARAALEALEEAE